MSTLSNISPTTGSNTPQEEQGTANGAQTSGGVTGLFEEIMAHALSPSAQLNSVQVNPKTSEKSAAKITGGSPETNGHSPIQVEPGTAVINPEITVNQTLAAAISMISPIGKEVVPAVPPAPVQTAAATKPAAISTPLLQFKGNPGVATKISTSDLSEQDSPAGQMPVAQKVNQLAGKEAELTEKNPEISMPIDSSTGSSKLEKIDFEPDGVPLKEPDSSGGTVTPLQPDLNGTSIAKQDVAMKQAEKTNNIAGQTEKVLPGGVVSAIKTNPSSYLSANSDQLTASAAANSSQIDNSSGTSTVSLDVVAGSATADMRTRTLERTQEMVAVNATRLTDSGNNSMQVVIKPDAGTQLSLELRQQGGSVHVQAVLQQGDFGHLNQQWSDLQQRLGLRGIQLAPLTDNAAYANSGGTENFQNKQNQTTEGVPEVSFADAPIGMFTPEAMPAPAHRGWETWA
jgi:hypothetical protein